MQITIVISNNRNHNHTDKLTIKVINIIIIIVTHITLLSKTPSREVLTLSTCTMIWGRYNRKRLSNYNHRYIWDITSVSCLNHSKRISKPYKHLINNNKNIITGVKNNSCIKITLNKLQSRSHHHINK